MTNLALAKQVDARNQLNAKANELAPRLQELLKPYLHTKVIKATPYQTWTKKVSQELSKQTEKLHEFGYRLTYTFLQYSVYADLDMTYTTAGEICHYLKVEFRLCSLNGDHLSAVEPITERRTDYTVEEVSEKRAQLVELEGQVNKLKSELREFSR